MNVGDIILWISAHWADVINLGTQVVGIFAIIASLTPNRTDDKILQVILDAVNFGGFNFGKAANRS